MLSAFRDGGIRLGMDYALYTATVIGAIALLLMMPRSGFVPRKLGALLGAATLGGLWLWLARTLPPEQDLGISPAAWSYYYVFSGVAIVAAVRVITHPKPVYSALWFVLVVLSSAGLFLTLGAEFMAFAMIIIYAGAILVTYVFVIMLASQAGDPADEQATEYDRQSREPVAAVAAGFLLLAVLLSVAFNPGPIVRVPGQSDSQIIQTTLTDRPAARVGDERSAQTLDNAERIGLDLFRGHPLGLELAGVILLVALVGAVVIARQRVEPETPGTPGTPETPGTGNLRPET